MNYKPLPADLTIDNSDIHGLGIFAESEFPCDCPIGISHIYNDTGYFPHNLIRTPLGGFLNHSDTPNCTIKKVDTIYRLVTTDAIFAGEELTVDYQAHECGSGQLELF